MFRKTREKSPYYLVSMDFGYTLLAAVGIFGYFGYRLDLRYGSIPWFMLAGIGLGLAVAFNGLFRRLNLLEGQRRKAKKGPRDPRQPEDPQEPGEPKT